MNLEGKRALVTGASKGLGAAVAQRLAAAGSDVAIHYHSDREGADATAAAVRAEGREPLLLQADMAVPGAVAVMAEQVAQAWGSLDLLVNSAGVAPVHSWDSITPEQWQNTLAVNLHGPFYALRFTVPLLRKAGEGAAVVNIGSVVSLNGGSFGPAYAAAKAGLDGLTRSAARDLGPLGIRVNSVLPGPIDSPLVSALPAAALQAMAAQTPLRRIGTFGEVAELVVWLLSPAAGYITGQMIIIDGGRVMH
jgi:3-oxoacyl-[acyl-carrier protein] reductase